MAVSGVVSIPSAVGSSTVFTVTGTRTLAYAQLLQSYLDGALNAGTLSVSLGKSSTAGTITFGPPTPNLVNEAVVSSNQSGGIGIGDTAYVPDGYQAVFDNVNGASTVVGNTTGLDGIFEGSGAGAATFIDNGGNNLIVFVDGNNDYIGDTTAAAGNDTIVAGSGFDTIDTGFGKSTVNSGTGSAVINLHDTAPAAAGAYNAYVWLDDGTNTVNANGVMDAVVANSPDQVIDGGNAATDFTGIVLLAGGDIVNGNAATIGVFDDSSGNSIFGGTGQIDFIGGANVAASIVAGTGPVYVFGGLGDNISLASVADTGFVGFIAGTGNETLNAGYANSGVFFYGDNASDSAVSAGISTSMTGGIGNDTFVSGSGYETMVGGAGNNMFIIDATTDGVGAQIMLADFGASAGNVVGFLGFSEADIQTALAGATTVTGAAGETDTVITLSDNTTVTFVGISSLTGHTIGT
jgi:hypothetical protein